MKNILIIFLVFYCCFLSAQLIIIEELIQDNSDISLIANPVKDSNGQDCAIIRVHSILAPFDKIETNMKVVKREKDISEDIVWISPNEKQITFKKEGFLPLTYVFPSKLLTSKVYSLMIGTEKDKENIIYNKVTFKTPSPGFYVSVNGRTPVFTAKSKEIMTLVSNQKHLFKVFNESKKGSIIQCDVAGDSSYTVDMSDQISIEITEDYGTLIINNNLKKGNVYFNNVLVGNLKYNNNFKLLEGSYTLQIEADEHLIYRRDDVIQVRANTINELSEIKMIPDFALLKIESNPRGALIYVDGERIGKTPAPELQIEKGLHRIDIVAADYETWTLEDAFTYGENRFINVNLKRNYVDLTITSSDADSFSVEINDKFVGYTPLYLKDYHIGEYLIRVSKPLWTGSSKKIILKPEENQTIIMPVEVNHGTLIVNYKAAEIFLNNEVIGQSPLELDILPGDYTLIARKVKHHDYQTEIRIEKGLKTSLEIEPKPKIGFLYLTAKDSKSEEAIENADIYIDGIKTAFKTPSEIEILEGEYDITFKHPRYIYTKAPKVSIQEFHTKDLNIGMDSYLGTYRSKRDLWNKNSYISLGITTLMFSTGWFCNYKSNKEYGLYASTLDSENAFIHKNNSKDLITYRDAFYTTASISFSYSLISFITSRVYKQKSKNEAEKTIFFGENK